MVVGYRPYELKDIKVFISELWDELPKDGYECLLWQIGDLCRGITEKCNKC